MPRTLIETACANCGKVFCRPKAHVVRSERCFCSNKCKGEKWTRDGGWGGLTIGRGRSLNQLSPFRRTINLAKIRSKKHGLEFGLTAEGLKEIWDEQGGICPITGWKMWLQLGTRTKHRLRTFDERLKASLDRIDSAGGYVPENVRFVCLNAQFAKNSWTDAQLLEFCKAVVKHRGND